MATCPGSGQATWAGGCSVVRCHVCREVVTVVARHRRAGEEYGFAVTHDDPFSLTDEKRSAGMQALMLIRGRRA